MAYAFKNGIELMDAVNNKRILNNTLMLYFRMGVTMIVSLYTSRLNLKYLGIDNFGIWSVVGNVIVMVSFINGPLASATQRFINVAIGKRNNNSIKKIFNESLIINAIIGIGLLIILESLGVWFLNSQLTIPIDKIDAANVVYQIVLISFLLGIIRTPFDAIIIAYERFNFYALMGILEVVMKLAIVWLLPYAPYGETLIFFAILNLSTVIISTVVYVWYCRKHYTIARFQWIWEKPLLKELLSFSGWSTFGSFATVMSSQGLSVLFNIFFGLAVNAAIGITNQVVNAINMFISNFQTAFRPQIVKTYAANERQSTFKLMCLSSKVSCYLIFLLGFPIALNIDYILSIWLTEIPPFTGVFCQLAIFAAIFEAIGAPLWMIVQADGHIKSYQIVISSTYLLIVCVSYMLFKFGFEPYWAFIVKCLMAVSALLIRIFYVKYLSNYSIRAMINYMYLPEFIVLGLSPILAFLVWKMIDTSSLLQFIASTIVFIITYIPIVWYLGITRRQRSLIKSKVKLKLAR
ncbi:MAG: lipopolysaccharide biosynthesis protein [Bacteroides sp.]|nr:lipopolysaccharide biosynthesis protein [Bacteroides sp.]MCM1378730.1 lipopolysaccharide biosynthesis protein [Bacteroides sp.]MCM1445347.1 lipopolysaccharide biosynthesis protein [Prevotella sp.]